MRTDGQSGVLPRRGDPCLVYLRPGDWPLELEQRTSAYLAKINQLSEPA
jgi:hypothetical protein